MKPEQLNRLIRGNGRMQPWFLRNTSELYESAVRSYYERGFSAMPHSTYIKHPRLLPLEDNAGPVRKLKKAEPEPSYADDYPRSHQLQAIQAASIAAGQLLPTRMQTSRQRSMSFSVGKPTSDAQQYSVFGQTGLGDSSSISCSSASSEPSQHRLGTVALPRCLRRSRAMARRERKRMGRRGSRIIDVQGNGHQVDMDMRLFSARSLSVPPPTGLEMGNAPSSGMSPCRKHHMNAIEKTTLANAALIPMGEGDSLMTVDETLKRKISVVDQTGQGPGTSSQLGHHLMTNRKGNVRPGVNLLDVIRQPPQMRFRFHTLGDRAKQFEYIQFADGPVSNYAFNRRTAQRRLYKPNNSSSSSSLNTIGRQENQQMQVEQSQQQSRPLSARNVLHANHMKRSLSVEAARGHVLETPLPPPLPPPQPNVGDVYRHLDTQRGTREFGEDISSHFSARRHTAGESSASSVAQREGTAVAHLAQTNSEGIKAIKRADMKDDASGSKSSRSDRSELRVTWQTSVPSAEAGHSLERNNVTNSRPTNPEYRGSSVTPKLNSNSAGYNDTKGTSRDTDWRGSSMAKSQSQRSSVDASLKGSSMDFSNTEETTRGTCSSVRRAQMQRRPAPDDEDLPLSYLSNIESKSKHKMKTTLEKPKTRLPKVPKITANRMSRSSHRAFYQAAHEERDLPAGQSPKQKEKSEQRELSLEMQKWAHGSRAITVPSSQPVKASAQLKRTNQLLAASASQVSAYKRAFRTHQQILKVEALHKQAQSWQKPSPLPKPTQSVEFNGVLPKQLQLQLPVAEVRPTHLLRQQHHRQGRTLTVSRTSVRAALKANAQGKTQKAGAAKGAQGSPRSSVKAAAAPVTAPLTATPGTTTTTTTTTTARPSFRQKPQADRTTTSVRGAVSGAATATKAVAVKFTTKGEERSPRGGGVGSARRGAAGSMRQSALTLTMQQQQQQHSRNGSGNGNSSGNSNSSGHGNGKGSTLLGFRRETANRAASSLLQRRDESEQASSPLMSVQSPQHRQHQRQQQQQHHKQQQQQQQHHMQQQQQHHHQQHHHHHQQQQQQKHQQQQQQRHQRNHQQQPLSRQFHIQNTPWRPSY